MSTIKKVTMKDSKKTIGEFLAKTVKAVQKKDENLFQRINYTMDAFKKDESSATKRDLFDLAEEVMTLFATPVAAEEAKPKSETALKKSGTAKSKKDEEPVDDEGEETNDEETKKDDKKKSTGGSKKKSKVKDPKVFVQEQVAQFPETIERDGNKYEIALDIETIDDIYEALEKGEQFIFANVWTKRQLVQFPYAGGFLTPPKSFEDDLDLAALMYVSDEKKVAYAISTTTDGFYVYLPDEFENFYEEEGMGHRYCNTMEYEIYRVVETAEEGEEE